MGIIVKKHQGKINFYSNSNQGTEFTISIPSPFFWLLGFPLLNPTYESETSILSNKFLRIRNEPRRNEGHEGRRKKENGNEWTCQLVLDRPLGLSLS